VRPIGKNTFHYVTLFATQGLRVLSPLLTLPLIARGTSVTEFGEFSIYLTLAQTGAVLVDFGLSQSAYKNATTLQASDGRSLYASVLWFKIKLSLTAIILATILSFAFSADPYYAVAAAVLAAALGMSPLWFLNFNKRSGLLLLLEALPIVSMLLAALCVLLYGMSPAAVLAFGAVGGLLSAIMPLTINPEKSRLRLITLFGGSGATLRQQSGLAVTRLITAIYTTAIVPFASFNNSPPTLAMYYACEKFGSLAGVSGIVISQITAPEIAKTTSREAAIKRLYFALSLCFASSIIILGVLGYFSGSIIEMLYGPDYGGLGAGATIILGASCLSMINTVLWSGYLVPSRQSSGYLQIVLAGVAAAAIVLLNSGPNNYIGIALSKLSAEIVILTLTGAKLVRLRRTGIHA
jgi:O-antigen/teichoic acid export membrane protein